jgi:hypothetical protein
LGMWKTCSKFFSSLRARDLLVGFLNVKKSEIWWPSSRTLFLRKWTELITRV